MCTAYDPTHTFPGATHHSHDPHRRRRLHRCRLPVRRTRVERRHSPSTMDRLRGHPGRARPTARGRRPRTREGPPTRRRSGPARVERPTLSHPHRPPRRQESKLQHPVEPESGRITTRHHPHTVVPLHRTFRRFDRTRHPQPVQSRSDGGPSPAPAHRRPRNGTRPRPRAQRYTP